MKRQGGFTLIELVIVIVVLGILAATALPRIINVTDEARVASLRNAAASIRSAVNMARAQYMLEGDNSSSTVTLEGQSVNVVTENTQEGKGGRPLAGPNGILAALSGLEGFYTRSSGGVAVFEPENGGGDNCRITYEPGKDGDPVTVIDDDC